MQKLSLRAQLVPAGPTIPVTVRRQPLIAGLWGADSWTFRRTIWTSLQLMTPVQLADPTFRARGILDAGELRHELVHVGHYATFGTLRFLWRYVTRKSFRQKVEAEGWAAQNASWPRWVLR